MRYHGYFSQQRLATIEQYKVSMARLTETRKALDEQLEAQRVQSRALADRTKEVQTQRDERALAINALAQQRQDRTRQRDVLLADSERLRALLAQLRSELRSHGSTHGLSVASVALPRVLRVLLF